MLRALDENLWVVEHRQRMPGGWWMPLRMTIVRLPDGGLWLHSPVPLDDAQARAIEALGPVRHLVAPNALHHLAFGPAQARWPEARAWGAPGLAQKRPDLRFDATLGDGVSWGSDLRGVFIDGAPKVSETVFLVGTTLVVTDLLFHFPTADDWRTRLVLRMVGALGGLRQSRAWRFLFCKDRAAAAASVARLLRAPVTRIIPAHGEVLEVEAAAALRTALTWMAGPATARLAAG